MARDRSLMTRNSSRRAISDVRFGVIILLPLVIFAIAIVAYPLTYSLWISSRDINFLTKLDAFVGLQNYLRAFSSSEVGSSFILTVEFVAEVTIMTMGLAMGMALLLNETFRGRGIVRVIALLPWSMAGYATAVVWRYILSDQFGLISSILYQLGVVKDYVTFLDSTYSLFWVAVAFTWNIAPLGAFFILAGLQVIPQDLYNQARVDGLNPVRRFFAVTVPYVRYSIFIVVVLTTLLAATLTDVIIVMTGGGPGMATNTLAFEVYKIMFKSLDLGFASAIGWLLIAFALVLGGVYFLLLTRRRGAVSE